MATSVAREQIQKLLSNLPSAKPREMAISDIDARLFGQYCQVLRIANKVFPTDNAVVGHVEAQRLGLTSETVQDNLLDLALEIPKDFLVFAAVESGNAGVFSYMKAKWGTEEFNTALKAAVSEGFSKQRDAFINHLFSPVFKQYLTPEILAPFILSPHNPNFSLLILNQMPVGFFNKEQIVAAVQSAVNSADYSLLAGSYLNVLLSIAHNTCVEADYVQIFIDSCSKSIPDNKSGLHRLLGQRTPGDFFMGRQSISDIFCTVIKMDPAIVHKVLPIIFAERGDEMDTQAVIQSILHGDGDGLVRGAAQDCQALWGRISHSCQVEA
jgi:hypothetical protein